MQVVNKSSYISTIYSAIVVNKDTSQDPENKNRVQIYIPSVNFDYADHWEEYMNMKDKKSSEYFNAFPWAVTLKDNLNDGDDVYGSYIDGDGHQYIILGLKGGVSKSTNGLGGGNLVAGDLVNYAMSIILHNEIGVAISAWLDKSIPDSYYTTITLHDGGEKDKNTGQWIKQGCWAIGLIQWNGVRAYDTVYKIAEKDGNWETYFTNNCDLKSDIKSSLSSKSTVAQRNKYSLASAYNPQSGGATYNAIQRLISSSTGKEVQNELAVKDTFDTINMLIDEGCTNPAILIYMADFYNQYGSGYSQTTQKCVEACNQNGDMIKQLDWLIENQLKPNFTSSFPVYEEGKKVVGTGLYDTRRTTTYDYIVELYNDGKLNGVSLTDEGSVDYQGNGQYCAPFKGNYSITALWGPNGYLTHYNSTGTHYHTGIDFGCPSGTTLIACTEGTLSVLSESSSSGYGYCLKIMTNDGNMIIYGHMSSFAKRSGSVKKGDIIGYSGDTGNSTGAHLHFEIRKSPYKGGYNGIGNDVNPLPYIGAGDKGRDDYVSG